jgi:hypothetical protein
MKSLKALVLVFLLSGCGVSINANRSAMGYKPVLHLDPKPVLYELSKEEYEEYWKLDEKVREKIEFNAKTLAADSLKTRKVVERYNIWAGTQNALTAKNLGLDRGGTEDARDRKADVVGSGDDRDGRHKLDQ